MSRRRLDLVGLVALPLVLGGLVLLFEGLATAVPLIFFGTEEELAARQSGRVVVGAGAGVLAAAGLVLLARGRARPAAVVAAAGIVTWTTMWAAPDAGFAWLALLLLGPAALGAALVSVVRRHGR